MSVLSDNYKKIVEEIDSKISNNEEREFVKKKIMELSTLFLDVIDNLSEKTDKKIAKIEEKQQLIEEKINLVEGAVDEIENSIYEEDEEEYEFEIACPYCNSDFTAEISGKDEIECPICHNMIELEWNDEEDEQNFNCSGNCKSCSQSDEQQDEDNFEKDNNDDM